MVVLALSAVEDASVTVGGLIAIIAFVTVVIKTTVHIRSWVEATNSQSVSPIAAQLTGVSSQLSELSAVVGKNGGSTVHQRLDTLTRNFADLSHRVEAVDDTVSSLSDRQSDATIFARFVTHAIPPDPVSSVTELVEYWQYHAGQLAVDQVTGI